MAAGRLYEVRSQAKARLGRRRIMQWYGEITDYFPHIFSNLRRILDKRGLQAALILNVTWPAHTDLVVSGLVKYVGCNHLIAGQVVATVAAT